MDIYHPNIEINYILPNEYYEIERKYKPKIPIWDFIKTIENDNKCIKIVAEKFIDKDNPRIEFKIVTIE